MQTQPTSINEFNALIEKWYATNYEGFTEKFDAAVENVQDRPDGTADSVWQDWQGASITTLQNFFSDWFAWSPAVESGLDKIQQFSFLYYENQDGVDFVSAGPGLLMTEYFVVLNGQKYDDPSSKTLVDMWIKEIGPDIMDQYVIPIGGFKNFNEFFKREIKPEYRPIAPGGGSLVVSPADAVLNMIDDSLDVDRPLDVKTQKISPYELLNGSPLSKYFQGGTALSCILMPDVYHRYHSPVEGNVVESNQDVAGNYFGIKDFPKLIDGGNIGYGYDYSVFENFRRGYVIIETEKYGYVAVVPVGLNTIASVVFEEKFKCVTSRDGPVPILKGEEIGYFQYGGSLNILLFQKGVYASVRVPQGQGIGTMTEVSNTKSRCFGY